jgi:hypothetical protein
MGVEGGNDSSHYTSGSTGIGKDLDENGRAPWVLANRIHDGTQGLSTPPEANRRIESIQRIPRLPLPSLDE